MEITLNSSNIQQTNSLTFKHISVASDEILQYIDNRRKGIVKSLKTRWDKFNNTCNGGIEPNSIYVVAGISGSGKSAFANSLETDLFDLNPDVDFIVLSFSLEMLSSKQVGRKISYKTKKTTSELYTTTSPLSDYEFRNIEEETKKIKKYPIFYVDTPGTVDEVRNTILKFIELYGKDKWLVILYDHTLLTKSASGEQERNTLVNLQRMFIEIKKLGKTTIIQLSQLNREIEDKERITNPALHFPQRRDLSSSDAVFQCADYVLVLHRPELLVKSYGINNWPVSGMIYMHILKNRDGEPKVLSFINNLKYNSIEEQLSIINQI
jgi:replicative DNA helicase